MASPRLALPRLRRRLKGKKGVNRHASPYRLKNYARDFVNFQDIVDNALVLKNRRGIIERKRKMQCTGSQGSNTRFRVGSSSQ
jgi:hypothetical protein